MPAKTKKSKAGTVTWAGRLQKGVEPPTLDVELPSDVWCDVLGFSLISSDARHRLIISMVCRAWNRVALAGLAPRGSGPADHNEKCPLCLEEARVLLFSACHHRSCCIACASRLKGPDVVRTRECLHARCPLCRELSPILFQGFVQLRAAEESRKWVLIGHTPIVFEAIKGQSATFLRKLEHEEAARLDAATLVRVKARVTRVHGNESAW